MHLLGPLILLVVTIMVLMAGLLIGHEGKALSDVSYKVAVMADEVRKQQGHALKSIEEDQVQTTESSLRVKAESLTVLLARLAATPLLTFDYDALDEYCAGLSRDPDVLLAYITDSGAAGEVITTFRNLNDKTIQTVIGSNSQATVQEIAKALQARAEVFELSVPIREKDDAPELGRLVLLVSKAQVQKQSARIVANFQDLSESTDQMINAMRDDIKRSISRVTTQGGWLGLIIGVTGILVVVFLMGKIISHAVKPILECVDLAKNIAAGNLKTTVSVDRDDEIGVLAGNLNKMASSLRDIFRELSEKAQGLHKTASELSAISGQSLAGAVKMRERSSTGASATEEMSVNMSSVSEVAASMNNNLMTVASSTEQSSMNINQIAAAVQEMSKTIDISASKAEQANVTTREAVNRTKAASSRMEELQTAAELINKVIETIVAISSQTKLLALNATIEAARAGEVGKGFAVVAGEIKELAKQTNAASEDIRLKIETMQNSTMAAVKEINSIGRIISDVNDSVGSIASSMEEQAISTRDISDNIDMIASGIAEVSVNVSHASAGVSEVTGNFGQMAEVSKTIAADITEIHQASSQIFEAGNRVDERAASLAKMGDELMNIVERFKI